ncbi:MULTISPECIES: Flp pilus assembly protein CpaB [Vibrio]|uniref:Pilus assembly protein CpaB n=1 Tax=Vibrio bivalvicida TaxID=1276888 RepID=A0A177Y4R0_9VIBR|nr:MULTISPECIES: Flp pilus assembly protein CpaB [Vibrio]KLN63250.1 pilus assembly protein CpaB [Vibrio sp. VPAP30]OAJ95596.1 pilus assembly protein CpaB [Vibrio bivalvicida]
MNKKVLLTFAGLAILLGLYGLAGSLSKTPTQEFQPEVKQDKLITAWRLVNSVGQGQQVKRSDLELLRVTESKATVLGVAEDMLINFSNGLVYAADLNVGELIFQEHLVAPDQEGYVDLVIAKNRVPYAIKVRPQSIVGGVITHGTMIDVLSLSLPTEFSIETAETQPTRKRNMFVTPVLTGVKVLQVNKTLIGETRSAPASTEVNLILELTRKQVATLTVAKRISELEVHKSIGEYKKSDLHADAGDVLSNFKSVVEYRSNDVTIN